MFVTSPTEPMGYQELAAAYLIRGAQVALEAWRTDPFSEKKERPTCTKMRVLVFVQT